MIHMLSRGSYSDYGICSLWEGPEGDLQQLYVDFVKYKIGPEPPLRGKYSSPQWNADFDVRYAWQEKLYELEDSNAFHEHLATLGYKKLEYKEHTFEYDRRKQ